MSMSTGYVHTHIYIEDMRTKKALSAWIRYLIYLASLLIFVDRNIIIQHWQRPFLVNTGHALQGYPNDFCTLATLGMHCRVTPLISIH